MDNKDLLPVCYVCGSENSLLRDSSNDSCINCGHPFLRCFLNFDVLPLVELIFEPDDGISNEEAIDLIVNQESPNDPKVMFDKCIQESLQEQNTAIVVSRDVLASLDREDVFILASKDEAQKCRYFRNLLPEIGIALCQECCHFFHEEDFEFTVLRDGGCPFCGCSLIGKNYGHA
jgi:intraflagellar transport protein 122